MIAPLIYHRKNPAFLRAGMETFSNIFSQRFQRPDNAFTHRLNGHALGLGNLGSTHAHKEKGIEALGLLVRQGGKGGVQLGHDRLMYIGVLRGHGLVHGVVFYAVATVKGIIRLVVAQPVNIVLFLPLAFQQHSADLVRHFHKGVTGIVRVKIP